jgi:ACT domain
MTPYRIRIRLEDEPGRLGRAATALSKLGINILDVDVQSDDGELWADDLLIDFPFPIDPSTIDHALHLAGVELVDLRPADSHEVVDSTVHCLELVDALAADRAITDDTAVRAARAIVRSDLAWITPLPVLSLHGVAADAMISGDVTQAREWAKLVRGDAPVWTLAVPFDHGLHRRVLTLLRRAPRFSYTESARVGALLRVVATLATSLPPRDPRDVRSAPAHPQARTAI